MRFAHDRWEGLLGRSDFEDLLRKESSVDKTLPMRSRFGRRLLIAFLTASLILLMGCAEPPLQLGPEGFETPEAAAAALIEALAQEAPDALLDVVGHQYRDALVTANWIDEREERLEIVSAAREQLELSKQGDSVILMLCGPKGWPFPAPIVREGTSWHFDMQKGLAEMRDREVGRNELAMIELLGAYVDAQIEYARADWNDDGVLEYAQRIVSTKGQRDGLYWPSAGDEPKSPFGSLVEGAERDRKKVEPGVPFSGYYFKILTQQGSNPKAGQYDYKVNDHLVAGFALVAYPAEYAVTGVMTFVVNHEGTVYEKDRGPFEGMSEYDPDDTWQRAGR